MKSTSLKRIITLFSALIIFGCTKSENQKLKEIEKQLSAAEDSLAQIEAALKKVPKQNQGLAIKLNQDKQLAISRLERLKENLTAIAPEKKWAPKGSEGSEGGTGGH